MRLLKVEVPLVIGCSLLLWALSADERVDRLDGAVLLARFLGLVVYMYRNAGDEPSDVKEEIGLVAAETIRVRVAVVWSRSDWPRWSAGRTSW